MLDKKFTIAIIGMGPRGLSVLERLCANHEDFKPEMDIVIHIVDPYLPGSGKVWRTDQSRHLLMNTVASQITLFTDSSVECIGPITPGPTLYEWAKFNVMTSSGNAYTPYILEEAAKLTPNSYPSRAFYGYYLQWIYKYIDDNKPANYHIHFHHTAAIALHDSSNKNQIVNLQNGSRLLVNKVVLTTGHTETALSKEENKLAQFASENKLVYISPSNPSDVSLNNIKPKEKVILRGLGLNFFDYMALFTVGRGGKYVRKDGKLIYEASGLEPYLYAGSRRGIPYHARGENEKASNYRHSPLILNPKKIQEFQAKSYLGEDINFKQEIWPLIAKEVEIVYYRALIDSKFSPEQGKTFTKEYLNLVWGSDEEKEVIEKFKIEKDEMWSWENICWPYKGNSFNNQKHYTVWLLDYLKKDLYEAKKGNVSGPIKAALDVLRDLRNEIRLVIDHNGICGNSYKEDIHEWYTQLNAFVSIGPPALRIEQMIALITAGVLEVLPPNLKVGASHTNQLFWAKSATVHNSYVDSRVLIEARLPSVDIRRTTDKLLKQLLTTKQCKPFKVSSNKHFTYETGGIAVTPLLNNLIEDDSYVHPDRFVFGIPTEGVYFTTAAGIRPGINSTTLVQSDAISREILTCAIKTIDNQLLATV